MAFPSTPRFTVYAGIFLFFICGCSSGGGSPSSPPLTPSELPPLDSFEPASVQRGPTITGSVGAAIPPLAWEFTEPGELLDAGWKGEPKP